MPTSSTPAMRFWPGCLDLMDGQSWSGVSRTTVGYAQLRGPFNPHTLSDEDRITEWATYQRRATEEVTGGPYRGVGPFAFPGLADSSSLVCVAQYVAYCLKCLDSQSLLPGDQVYVAFTWPADLGNNPKAVIADRLPKIRALFAQYTGAHDYQHMSAA